MIEEALTGRPGLMEVGYDVVVSGISTSDPSHIQVISNSDPGTGKAVVNNNFWLLGMKWILQSYHPRIRPNR